MQNVEWSLIELSVSVLLVYKEIPKTFVLRLAVELTQIVPSTKNVIAFSLPHKQENVKDFALEILVLKVHHVMLKTIERSVPVTLHFEETAIINVDTVSHRSVNTYYILFW